MAVGFPLFLAVIVVALVFYLRRRSAGQRAVILRRTGFTIMALSTSVFALFLAGETIGDPGGWKALWLVCVWAVPLAALVAIAWLRPDLAVRVFAFLVAGVVGVTFWFAVAPQAWRAVEDRNGPIRAVVAFVVAAGIAVLGLKRTAAAGVLLLALGIVPIAASSAGSLAGVGSLAVATSTPVLSGLLYLLSALASREQTTIGP